ncbi:putative PilT protein domain-containing protein [Candidatus Nitrososphaera gargensis Ga9.2]|uniref:Putative PilT protein domain-containing protein n=1 Tax=Nitrososphaera gargensis (strain Ga9.2) TaxID=1237085 RepID=K0IKN0_NITGG|nr:putative PilT protein domain-containing protein [Candidatus Nitrososphaera gargensis Ga9.2]
MTGNKIVIDASVIAKWYNNEALTDKALLVLQSFINGRIHLCAPEHLLYEVGNSIWKNKALSTADCMQAMNDLMEMDIEFTRLDPAMASKAMKLARDLSISYYDALYIQLSIDRHMTLLSADVKLISKARGNSNAMHLKDCQEQ